MGLIVHRVCKVSREGEVSCRIRPEVSSNAAVMYRYENQRPARRAIHASAVMTSNPATISVGEAPEIQAFLAERIYEFNSKATGYFDGESFSRIERDDSDVIIGGICGYTWGGCAYVSYLWVAEAQRGHGLGTALLVAAEEHARTKSCSVMFLATHSFQAPRFYERLGYERQAFVQDHPLGHASMIFAKRLQTSDT